MTVFFLKRVRQLLYISIYNSVLFVSQDCISYLLPLPSLSSSKSLHPPRILSQNVSLSLLISCIIPLLLDKENVNQLLLASYCFYLESFQDFLKQKIENYSSLLFLPTVYICKSMWTKKIISGTLNINTPPPPPPPPSHLVPICI